MHLDMKTAETILTARLGALPDAAEIAWATIWLEACGYSGVRLLGEALKDEHLSAVELQKLQDQATRLQKCLGAFRRSLVARAQRLRGGA